MPPLRASVETLEDLSQAVFVPADEADPGAGGGERLRDRPSDALGAAADDRMATVESLY